MTQKTKLVPYDEDIVKRIMDGEIKGKIVRMIELEDQQEPDEIRPDDVQDGDIVVCWWQEATSSCKWISIVRSAIEETAEDIYIKAYADLVIEADGKPERELTVNTDSSAAQHIRPATQEEIELIAKELEKSRNVYGRQYYKLFFGNRQQPEETEMSIDIDVQRSIAKIKEALQVNDDQYETAIKCYRDGFLDGFGTAKFINQK